MFGDHSNSLHQTHHITHKALVNDYSPMCWSLESQAVVLGNWLPKRGLGAPIRSSNTNRSWRSRDRTGWMMPITWETLSTHPGGNSLLSSSLLWGDYITCSMVLHIKHAYLSFCLSTCTHTSNDGKLYLPSFWITALYSVDTDIYNDIILL